MATVQITFTDASDNEDEFIIYRGLNTGANPDGTNAAEKVATLTWNSGGNTWDVTQEVLDAQSDGVLTGQVPGDPSTPGQIFIFQYTENNAGTWFYGVIAKNSIGPSAITVSSSGITV